MRSSLLVALLVALVGLATAQYPCTGDFQVKDPTTTKTWHYNIKQFAVDKADTANMVTGQESAGGWTAYVNICGDASAIGCTTPTPACQDIGDGKTFWPMGTLEGWKMAPYSDPATPGTPIYDGGVTAQATGGKLACKGDTIARQTYLWLKCDPQVTARPATAVAVQEKNPANPTVDDPCQYYFAPISHAMFCGSTAGPPSSGGSGEFDYGWVFVIIVLCGLFLYFTLGIIILKFAQHKEGREIVPNVDFWAGLPSLVLDGMKYTLCCVPCRGGGGYEEV